MTCDMSVVFSGYSGFLHYKTDRHDITEILLKVALNTITLTISINIRFVYLVNLGVYIFDDAVYFSVCLFSFIVK